MTRSSPAGPIGSCCCVTAVSPARPPRRRVRSRCSSRGRAGEYRAARAPGPIGNGGVPGRRAVIRWAWRLCRREWRQQILLISLLAIAVAATILGPAIAYNAPSTATAATFGTANEVLTVPGDSRYLAADLAAVRRDFGAIGVIENQAIAVPGTVSSIELRAQDPHGRYGQPTLALVSGRYPTGPDEVALTSGVASLFNVRPGDLWRQAGRARRVTGLVEDPANLLDQFALVTPGQVSRPTTVTVLFDAAANSVAGLHLPGGSTPKQRAPAGNKISPATVVLAVAVFGLLLIGLVAVAGFAAMAQRRRRALGMLGALGATDRNVRLVMVTNGFVVGLIGMLIGAAGGFLAWICYASHLQRAVEHRVAWSNVPWWAIAVATTLPVVTATAASWRPARAAARVPIVVALSGRPASPRASHRSAVSGSVLLVGGLGCLTTRHDGLLLVAGIVATALGVLLLAPVLAAGPAAVFRRAPVPVRLALRDLGRYRARSGPALAAIGFVVLLATLTGILATTRSSSPLMFSGPNLAANQLIVYEPHSAGSGYPGDGPSPTPDEERALQADVTSLAKSMHARLVVALDAAGRPGETPCLSSVPSCPGPVSPLSAGLAANQRATLWQATSTGTILRNEADRMDEANYQGPLYVATPSLLRAYGIKIAQLGTGTDIVTSRRGLRAVPVPTGPLHQETEDPDLRRSPVRHLGPQHAHHRARGPATPPATRSGRLAHPDARTPHPGSGQRRPSAGIGRRDAHRDLDRAARLFYDSNGSHRGGHHPRSRRAGRHRRLDTQRGRRRSAHPHSRRGEQHPPSRARRCHCSRPRPPWRAARHRRRLPCHHRMGVGAQQPRHDAQPGAGRRPDRPPSRPAPGRRRGRLAARRTTAARHLTKAARMSTALALGHQSTAGCPAFRDAGNCPLKCELEEFHRRGKVLVVCLRGRVSGRTRRHASWRICAGQRRVALVGGERSLKPSAQPTLVRTQHLPPSAKTVRWLQECGTGSRSGADGAGLLLIIGAVHQAADAASWSWGCEAGAVACRRQGKLTWMCRPPWGRARVVRAAPWAPAMAATMDRPSPWPSPARPAARWKGWNRRSMSAGGMTGPVLATDKMTCPSSRPVVTSMVPAGRLYWTALSMRLAARRSIRSGSPCSGAGPSQAWTWSWRCWIRACAWCRPAAAASDRSAGSRRGRPASLVARVSSASRMRSCCLPDSRSSWPAARHCPVVAAGLRSVTCRRVRSRVSGVRSSWEALATKWRWAVNDASRRASRSSRVSASSLNSSSGPASARRSYRLVAEIRRAVAVMARTGRSTRPAITQPSANASTAMTPSAMPDWARSTCSSNRCARRACWDRSTQS